jgi:acetamidase/formamidase
MCSDSDHHSGDTPRQDNETALREERRGFLKGALLTAAGGAVGLGAASVALVTPAAAQARTNHYYVPATDKTVHWGYFSKTLKPVVEVESGDFVTIEALTHHANDDAERMVKGDPGLESVFRWDKTGKGVNRRGAGPMDASIFGRGAGEGFGVHILTGPVAVRGAEPGDVLEVRIIDVKPRPTANPKYPGKAFGSNAAAWWGFHYHDLLTEPKPREVVTIYEIDATGDRNWARALYNFRWTPQTDPSGVVHKIIDYPGVPVDHSTITENHGILQNVRVPIRPHFGIIGLAPAEADFVDSIPPGYFGGNMDNWRIGKGATMYYPVAVPGGLLSVGDSHASQGDSELCGSAIAHRGLPARAAQERGTSGHFLGRSQISAARDPGRMGAARLQLCELSGRARREGAVADLREVLPRRRHARRLPQGAAFPHDDQRAERGRSDLADLDRRRFRRDASGRRQLGRPRHHQEEHLRRRRRGVTGSGRSPLTKGEGCRVSYASNPTRLRANASAVKGRRSSALSPTPM